MKKIFAVIAMFGLLSLGMTQTAMAQDEAAAPADQETVAAPADSSAAVTEAPAPANSTSGAYSPAADSATPAMTNEVSIRAGVSLVRSMRSCPTTQISPPQTKARKYSTSQHSLYLMNTPR